MIFPPAPLRLSPPLPIPRQVLYRDVPRCRLRVTHGGRTFLGRAVVDTMADFTLLPEYVAEQVGLDLIGVAPHVMTVIGGAQVAVRFAEVVLEIQGTVTQCRWRA